MCCTKPKTLKPIFSDQTRQETQKEGYFPWRPWPLPPPQCRHLPCLWQGLRAWRRCRPCTLLCCNTTFICNQQRGPAINPQFLIKSGYYIVPSPSTTLPPCLHIWVLKCQNFQNFVPTSQMRPWLSPNFSIQPITVVCILVRMKSFPRFWRNHP